MFAGSRLDVIGGDEMTILLEMAQEIQPDMVAWRRAFHRQPELTHRETGTHRMIRRFLDEMGIPFLTSGDTITVAEIKGKVPGKTSAIRADTDALPVCEETGAEYASRVPGLMHACGHDMHMAIGLGAAKLFWEMRDSLPGKAMVIFQPAEEGGHGAGRVVESGLVDEVNAFFALHVWPQLETGAYRLSPGPVCAAADKLMFDMAGRGGHGAYPELCHSALLAAAETALALKSLTPDSPQDRPLHVLSMGQIHTGTNWNVIPGGAWMEGSLRTLDEALREELHIKIRNMAENSARKHGCTASLQVDAVCGIVYNDEALTNLVKPAFVETLGEGAAACQQTALIGDDFSDYRAIAPCCYAHLGVKRKGQTEVYALHHPKFDPDEAAMPVGLAGLCASVLAVNQSV
jgi:amidohydrolase